MYQKRRTQVLGGGHRGAAAPPLKEKKRDEGEIKTRRERGKINKKKG